MMARILLVGCGDLGMRVARLLLARGDEVWALRRQPPVASPPGLHWIAADLTVPATLAALPAGITHIAYLPAPDTRDPQCYHALFPQGLQALYSALRDVAARWVLISSSAVYGDHSGAWVTEDTPPNPAGFNGHILLEAERWLTRNVAQAIVLRLAGLYGPGRLQLLERLRLGLASAPKHPPHWANRIHIDDAARAVVHLLHLAQPLSCYIGSDDTPLPLDVLYTNLANQLGAPAPTDGPAPALVGSKRLSNARLLDSGFTLQWPDARLGYRALIDAAQAA